jgi:dihydroflavonol-4-reductase
MKILVTGAPGFLGSPLVEELRRKLGPEKLRVLAVAPAPEFSDTGVEVQVGSILTPADVARALEGVTHVYHLAGFVSRKPAAGHRMFQIHVEGTRLLCEAALRAGVKRILMVSTSGTIAVSRRPDEMPDEDSPTPLELVARWPYYSSKLYQERTARQVCGDRIELVMVNPSLLLGPGDVRMGSTRDVLSFLSGDVKLVPSGGLNFVDARDVAAIIPVAMDKGRAGERYLLGGHNMTFAEYFDRIERVSKEYHGRLKVRGRWSVRAAQAQAALFRALGRSAPIEPAAVDQATFFWYFEGSKARNELGFAPREATETIFDTIQYIREHALGKGAFTK